MSVDESPLTLGVEEEFHVVDLHSRRLVPAAPDLLGRLPARWFGAELQQSTVETNTAVCHTLGELGAEVYRLRQHLIGTATARGLGIAAAGTVPISASAETRITRNARFHRMLDNYQMLVREQLICGAQVHVGLPDRDVAVAVSQRITRWLPPLLALSASSPYWAGEDTGYASARTLVWQRWPTAGLSGEVSSAAEYDALIEALVASGVISDPAMIYFDVRPSSHLPTIELRVCDACPVLDDVLLLAGLFRALVRRERDAVMDGVPAVMPPMPMQRAAMWRAARSGLEGDLVDPLTLRPAPAADILSRLVKELGDYLAADDAADEVQELAAAVLRRGSSASRQRAAYRKRGRLTDVVDHVLEETGAAPSDESAGMSLAAPWGAH
jgi:carboxylate-amine ligase